MTSVFVVGSYSPILALHERALVRETYFSEFIIPSPYILKIGSFAGMPMCLSLIDGLQTDVRAEKVEHFLIGKSHKTQ